MQFQERKTRGRGTLLTTSKHLSNVTGPPPGPARPAAATIYQQTRVDNGGLSSATRLRSRSTSPQRVDSFFFFWRNETPRDDHNCALRRNPRGARGGGSVRSIDTRHLQVFADNAINTLIATINGVTPAAGNKQQESTHRNARRPQNSRQLIVSRRRVMQTRTLRFHIHPVLECTKLLSRQLSLSPTSQRFPTSLASRQLASTVCPDPGWPSQGPFRNAFGNCLLLLLIYHGFRPGEEFTDATIDGVCGFY